MKLLTVEELELLFSFIEEETNEEETMKAMEIMERSPEICAMVNRAAAYLEQLHQIENRLNQSYLSLPEPLNQNERPNVPVDYGSREHAPFVQVNQLDIALIKVFLEKCGMFQNNKLNLHPIQHW